MHGHGYRIMLCNMHAQTSKKQNAMVPGYIFNCRRSESTGNKTRNTSSKLSKKKRRRKKKHFATIFAHYAIKIQMKLNYLGLIGIKLIIFLLLKSVCMNRILDRHVPVKQIFFFQIGALKSFCCASDHCWLIRSNVVDSCS